MSNYLEKLNRQGYYIIAEIGVNYYEIAELYNISTIEAAKLMMKKAKENGADAAKFQTYKAETLVIEDSPGAWNREDIAVETQYELFQLYDKFGKEEYKELSDYGKEIGIDFLSTPFDDESVEYLSEMMDAYKISSSDISNIPMIKKIASYNKPIILSTGASYLDEIKLAVETIKKYNDNKLTLLHCVLEYPTPYEDANLLKIPSIIKEFPDVIVGFSDHTYPDEHMDVLKTAYHLGARVFEKHFTLDKTIKKKNDHFHSMDCKDLKTFKNGLEFVRKLYGSPDIICLDTEITTRNSVRRSAITRSNMKKGDIVTEDNVIFKRPGGGISPVEMADFYGKRLSHDVSADYKLKNEDFE